MDFPAVREKLFEFRLNNRSQHPASAIALSLLLAFTFSLSGCRGNQTAEPSEDPSRSTQIDNSLIFNNVTLKQAGDQGKTLWEVQAGQVVYSQDKQLAVVTGPSGVLYDNNKPSLRVQARSGEIQQDGKRIALKGQVVATDLKSGAVIRADELEWQPETGVIVLRNNIVGTHPKVRFSGKEVRLFNGERRLEATGQVVILASNPKMRIQSDKLTWFMDEERITSDHRVNIARLTRDDRITDTAVADKAEANLKTQVVTLEQNAQIDLRNPPMQVRSNALAWNLEQETLAANQPVTVDQRQQQVTLTANQGRMDMKRNVITLQQNVKAVARKNRAQLESDTLVWNIPTQRLQAEGNVDYRQGNPPMRVRGPRASGRLDDQTVVVSGGRVVSEFYP